MFAFIQANLWTMVIVVSVMGCLIPVLAIIADHQRKVRQAELDHQLKRDLAAQGKSPEEIQEILEISSEPGPWWAKQAN